VIRELSVEEFKAWVKQENAWLRNLRDKQGCPEQAAPDLAFMNDMQRGMSMFSCQCWAQYIPEVGIVSVNLSRLSGRKRDGAWGRYVNFMYAYTRPPFRRMGYAKALLGYVEHHAIGEGYNRLRSLASTQAGYALHRSLKHEMWGITPKGEVIIDTELLAGCPCGAAGKTECGWCFGGQHRGFPEGPPRLVRFIAGGGPKRLSSEEIRELSKGKFQ